jgi:hypothetical protein
MCVPFICGCIRGVSQIMACGPVCCELSSTPAQVTRMTLRMFKSHTLFSPYIYPLVPPTPPPPEQTHRCRISPLCRLTSSPSSNNPRPNQPDPTSDPIFCVYVCHHLRPCDWICRSPSLPIAIYRTNSIICRTMEGLRTSNSTARTGQSYMRIRKVKIQASTWRSITSFTKSDLVRNLRRTFLIYLFCDGFL